MLLHSIKTMFYHLNNYTNILNHLTGTFSELSELRKQVHHLFYVNRDEIGGVFKVLSTCNLLCMCISYYNKPFMFFKNNLEVLKI